MFGSHRPIFVRIILVYANLENSDLRLSFDVDAHPFGWRLRNCNSSRGALRYGLPDLYRSRWNWYAGCKILGAILITISSHFTAFWKSPISAHAAASAWRLAISVQPL